MRNSTTKTALLAALAIAILVAAVIGMRLVSRAEAKSARPAEPTDTSESNQAKVERAMSAGPLEIARSAKIIDKDAQGHTVVLREGTNGLKGGAVFLMNTTSVEDANQVLEGLPLHQAKLLTFELIPLGPLSPLQV